MHVVVVETQRGYSPRMHPAPDLRQLTPLSQITARSQCATPSTRGEASLVSCPPAWDVRPRPRRVRLRTRWVRGLRALCEWTRTAARCGVCMRVCARPAELERGDTAQGREHGGCVARHSCLWATRRAPPRGAALRGAPRRCSRVCPAPVAVALDLQHTESAWVHARDWRIGGFIGLVTRVRECVARFRFILFTLITQAWVRSMTAQLKERTGLGAPRSDCISKALGRQVCTRPANLS